jgi:hypothetical protein
MKTIKQLKTQQRLGGTPNRPVQPISNADAAAAQAASANTVDVNQQIEQLARARAREIIAEQQQAQVLARNGRTFTKFDAVNDIVDNQTETVTAGLWSDNVASLTTYFTSSTQTDAQRRYYVDVFQKDPAATGSAVQYSLAYGNALGSGSDSVGTGANIASKAVYSQYRQLLLDPTDTRFTTQGSGSTDSIYVINFKRNRLKERLDAGNFEIPLGYMSASADLNATGSNTTVSSSGPVITLIDDSGLSDASVTPAGKVYNIVSGSINGGVYNASAPVYYGLAYPDYGTLILDGKMLDQQLNFQTNTGSDSEGNNHFRLFHSISGSAGFTDPSTSDPYGFLARNSEKVTSTHYFVRIKNAEYNFSNNPSYTTGSVGELAQTSFVGDPKTYITTVGLYNDSQELLAVAKLSKPLLKSFQREALIRVKLDF